MIYAQPYQNDVLGGMPEKSFYHLEPGEIIHDYPVYKSRAFCIRYSHETIDIRELCQFRAEIDADQGYEDTEFFLEADLMFHKRTIGESRMNFIVQKMDKFEF